MQIYLFILYFFVYGFLGWCTEVAYATVKQKKFVNRGFLNGPICPVYGIGVGTVVILLGSKQWGLAVLYIVSTVLVTAIEGVTGYLMDKLFHHKWWDYSNQPFNIGGYVCLIFSLAWGVACVIIVRVIHPVIQEGIELIPYRLRLVLITVFGTAGIADLYVTTAGILKLNKKLEAMEKIAAELREISDKLGENIHENVMETMEISEERKKQWDTTVSGLRERWDHALEEQKDHLEEQKDRMEEQMARIAELRSKRAELKSRYAELAGRSSRVTRRLLGAFPGMESRLHKEILNELKLRVRRREDGQD